MFKPTARNPPLPESEQVLSAAAHLQRILPYAVLAGGTASAMHAHHRFSRDADPVLTDLRSRFDPSPYPPQPKFCASKAY